LGKNSKLKFYPFHSGTSGKTVPGIFSTISYASGHRLIPQIHTNIDLEKSRQGFDMGRKTMWNVTVSPGGN